MARGILEMTQIPTNLREWNQFLQKINSLITVSNAPPGIDLTLSPGSVPIESLENVPTASFLGRPAIGAGAVLAISAETAAEVIDEFIDHGAIDGLGDDDHPQYVLRSILTDEGDVLGYVGGEVARIPTGTFAEADDFESGTYTPVPIGVANVASFAAFTAQYARNGTVGSVSGKVDVTATLGGTLTQLGISLPIASNLAAQQDCAGTAVATAVAQYGAIDADATNNRAQLNFISADTTTRTMMFQFQYRIA